MSTDKKFVIRYNIVVVVHVVLLAIATLLWGKANKRLWMVCAVCLLLAFTVATAIMSVRYLRQKKREGM